MSSDIKKGDLRDLNQKGLKKFIGQEKPLPIIDIDVRNAENLGGVEIIFKHGKVANVLLKNKDGKVLLDAIDGKIGEEKQILIKLS